MNDKQIFLIFGTLQTLTLSAIIYLVFRLLNMIAGIGAIGQDIQILLSILFPLSLLIVEYMIYSKK
ncbi:MAG: hypothetical protein KAJ88_00685 [Candidatus Aenigmarchaeota archaeon]|nr:hypothetical protein [Candidatus Aenigmarchaeota archaeon]